MQQPPSWPGWQRRPWIQLLSGTTLPPSTVSLGAAAWISSLPASPASPGRAAGKQLGIEDERWIWPEIARVVREVEPEWVFLENVTGLVQGDLNTYCGSGRIGVRCGMGQPFGGRGRGAAPPRTSLHPGPPRAPTTRNGANSRRTIAVGWPARPSSGRHHALRMPNGRATIQTQRTAWSGRPSYGLRRRRRTLRAAVHARTV